MPDEARVVMALDYGARCLGVAIGQSITRTGRPLAVLAWQEPPLTQHWAALDQLIQTWQPGVILVGIPLTLSGERQWTTQAAEAFAGALKARYSQAILGIDETLTTREAKSRYREHQAEGLGKLKERRSKSPSRDSVPKERLDSWAASVLIEAYFRGEPVSRF